MLLRTWTNVASPGAEALSATTPERGELVTSVTLGATESR